MSKLATILETKRGEVEARKAVLPESEILARLRDAPPTRGFRRAIEEAPRPVALIAEVKKASPSEGLIRPDFDPAEVARAYARAGAHALSVLTDVTFFQGADAFLQLAREASGLPALRKDFTIDPYQIAESRLLGADAILLIAAALSPAELREYREASEALEMDALVEVHSFEEAAIARESGATLVGVNNRDLSTFATDLGVSEAILPTLEGLTRISESALASYEDVERVRQAGATAVLIGTTFCREPNIEAKVREVMGW